MKYRSVIPAILFTLLLTTGSIAASELPPLNVSVNDFASMVPAASLEDLEHRLARFHTETGQRVVVLTIKQLADHDANRLARAAFEALPLSDAERRRSAILVVARHERTIGFHAGQDILPLLPRPAAEKKILEQVSLYSEGMRPDLGVHGAVHYMTRVMRREISVLAESDEERLEHASLEGKGAGAIFAVFLGPFLAFFIGIIWGIYATQYGVQRGPRLLMGAIFGGGTAKLVMLAMSWLGHFSGGLWYFILAVATALGTFGSLTEFWMSGDWRGIPQEKKSPGKPENNMGV